MFSSIVNLKYYKTNVGTHAIGIECCIKFANINILFIILTIIYSV